MSSINKDFRKCLPQSFLVKHELFEFRTLKIKSFQNTSLSFCIQVIIFLKTKLQSKHLYFQLCTRSGMCLLLYWQTCKTVNLYVFLSALYTLRYVPIVNISCNLYIYIKKKKKKMTHTLVLVKIPKLCHNTLLSIFSLGKGRESLRLKTYIKLITSALSDHPQHAMI